MATQLLEREQCLTDIGDLVGLARTGVGRVAMVEGTAGVGKTALLDEARSIAERAGFRVLVARGGELERDFTWGIVRALFERMAKDEADDLLVGAARLARPAIFLTDDSDASSPGRPESVQAVLHGLYWLAANLAERSPVLLVIDDAHWADTASLQYLHYLARRLDGLGILVLLAARVDDGARAEPQPLTQLSLEPVTRHVRLRPLSLAGTAAMIERSLGSQPDDDFCRACQDATGGTPFFVVELLRALHQDGAPAGTGAIQDVESMGTPTIARSVRLRVARLGSDAVALTHAIAVLGSRVELRSAAALVDLDLDQATRLADDLSRIQVLAPGFPLSFIHPIVRRSAYDDVLPAERSRLHRKAAQLLAADGASTDQAAAHLLDARPAADPRCVELLRKAAREALERAVPQAACAYLTRALAEPPESRQRVHVLHELGRAEIQAGRPAAEHLRAALDGARDPAVRAEVAHALVMDQAVTGSLAESADLLARLLDTADDEEVGLQLEASLATIGMGSAATVRDARERLERLRPQADRATPAGRTLLRAVVLDEMLTGRSATQLADLATRALRGGKLVDEITADEFTLYTTIAALYHADAFDAASRAFEAAFADARRRGSRRGFALASCFRSDLLYRRGHLAAAEADARAAIDAFGNEDGLLAIGRANLTNALLERAAIDEALDALHSSLRPADAPPFFYVHWEFEARGRALLAAGRPNEALESLLACGDLAGRFGVSSPALLPWRTWAARAHLALDQRTEAMTLAAQEVELARAFGAPRALGTALTVAGTVRGGESGLRELEEAVSVLDASPARLEHARALVELGAALRRANRRQDCRDPLRLGLDLAHRCGAISLAERADTELRASGARPRRTYTTGREALTPSELRIAEMAAGGQSNKAIAQALFVTQKTIETHLYRAYQKLGIGSRDQLVNALDAPSSDPAR